MVFLVAICNPANMERVVTQEVTTLAQVRAWATKARERGLVCKVIKDWSGMRPVEYTIR